MDGIPITSWTIKGKVWIDPKKELEYDMRQGNTSSMKYPKSCIICYQKNLVNLAKERFNAKKLDNLLGCNYYEFKYKDKRIGIVQSGIGAPMAALILERLIVRGVKQVISAGIAGSLQYKGIFPSDSVLCTNAVRNEGTSYHYQKPSKYAYPDETLLKEIKKTLEQEKIPYHEGPTITIDAPYQFTVKEAMRLRKEGVLTSDMEAAAIFAIAKFRKIGAASMFIISDLATKNFDWNPHFHSKELINAFEKSFKASIETLAK